MVNLNYTIQVIKQKRGLLPSVKTAFTVCYVQEFQRVVVKGCAETKGQRGRTLDQRQPLFALGDVGVLQEAKDTAGRAGRAAHNVPT